MLPAILSSLVRAPARRSAAEKGSLARRLAEAPEPEREQIVLELVVRQVAGVLGHATPDAIDPLQPFKDLGFDSLAAVELRNNLARAADVALPATLIFDYPTPAAVATYLRGKVAPERSDTIRHRYPARRAGGGPRHIALNNMTNANA